MNKIIFPVLFTILLSGCDKQPNNIEECLVKIRKIDMPNKCLQAENSYECENRLQTYCGDEFLIDASKLQLNNIKVLSGQLNFKDKSVSLEIINKNDNFDVLSFEFEVIMNNENIGTASYRNYLTNPIWRLKSNESRKITEDIYNYNANIKGDGFEINIIKGKGFISNKN